MKFAICHATHLTLGMLLPCEIKNSNFLQIFSRYGRKCKQIAFLIVSNFASLIPILTANKIFPVTVLLLIYINNQFVAPEIRHSRRHCSVCQQSTWYSATVFSDEDKILIKILFAIGMGKELPF